MAQGNFPLLRHRCDNAAGRSRTMTMNPLFDRGSSSQVQPGQVLGGKYRIERILGEGGMGFVVAATHLQLDEKVAIKLILPEAARSKEAVDRFLREARAAVKIKSEHVVRVSDVGTLDSGMPFIVMEYLSGQDLAELLHASGPLPAEQAIEFVLQACEALVEAHGLGIIHRDLKPANLFLTRRADGSPCVKVLDFGISKIDTGESKGMTATSAVMGSPMYMSPEQMKSSRNVDARTDIWALGVILYELLAGVPPYDAETVPMLCVKVMQEAPPPLRATRPDLPPALETVILRCHEKDPERRFRTVGELAEALAPFVSGRAQLSAQRVIEIARTTGGHNAAMRASTPGATQQSSGPIAIGNPSSINTGGATVLAGPAAGAVPNAQTAVASSTAASWSGSAANTGARKKSSMVPVAAALGGALLIGGIVAFFSFRKPSVEPETIPVQAAQQATTLAPDAPPAPTVSPAATEAPTAESAPEPSAEPSTEPSAEPSTKAAATPPPANKPSTRPSTQTPSPKPPPPTSHSPIKPKPGGDLFGDRK